MREDAPAGGAPALEVSTWFQTHRDRDEYCCNLAFVTAQSRVSCTGYDANADFFDLQLIEFAKALIGFDSNPAGLPTFEVEDKDLHDFESCRVRITQARKGVARLEFHHRSYGSQTIGRTWVDVEGIRTFHVEIPAEDVRDMAYGLLSAVSNGKIFSFRLNPAPEAMEPGEDGTFTF